MVQRWADGAPTTRTRRRWQVELWRRLRARIGQPSPAERLVDACQRLRDEPELLDLPPRLSLFGLTRLAGELPRRARGDGRGTRRPPLPPASVAGAVADGWSPWSARRRATSSGPRTPPPARRGTRCCSPGGATPARCSWCSARPSRTARSVRRGSPPGGADAAAAAAGRHPGRPRRRRASAGGDVDARPLLATDDDSIRVHSCHGRGRQVEVLRDAVLHLLEDDPSLEPRDIIVMCPDIETFAPLIQATFGGRGLRGRIDRPRAHARDPAGRPRRCARPTR